MKTVLIMVLILGILAPQAWANTASWYGGSEDLTDPWVHQTTASGAKFNEDAFTAASWQYPLGSIVKVLNVENGKSVVVLINDRGPGKRFYSRGRIIDLTKASFAKIAELEKGVVNVKTVLIRGNHGKVHRCSAKRSKRSCSVK